MAKDSSATRARPTSKEHITLTVAPFGNVWSVMMGRGAYYGEHSTQTEARAAAEKWAEELRGKGHEVTIGATDKKPGGR